MKAIGGATVSGEKEGQLNAAGPKSWDSISASSDYRYQYGRWIFLSIYTHKFRFIHPVNRLTRLLQSSWWMIPSDLINKKVKRETDLRSNSGCTGPKQHLFSYQKLYLNNPTYEGQAKCFSPRNASKFLNKSAANQLQTALTKRPKNRTWACLHRLPTRKTRMALMHEVTLLTMCIEPTRSTTSFRWTRSLSLRCALSLQGYYLSPDEYQAYGTYYLYFQSTPKSLQGFLRPPRSCNSLDCLVATVFESLELLLQG